MSSVFGDIKLAVATSPPQRAGTVFGDIRIDLRGLRTGADRIDLHLSTVFGDIDVIVAEGVDAELHGRTVLGDRKVQLAPVAAAGGHAARRRPREGDLRRPPAAQPGAGGVGQPLDGPAGTAGPAQAAPSAADDQVRPAAGPPAALADGSQLLVRRSKATAE